MLNSAAHTYISDRYITWIYILCAPVVRLLFLNPRGEADSPGGREGTSAMLYYFRAAAAERRQRNIRCFICTLGPSVWGDTASF